MAVDPTYQPKVHRRQGGDELVVASGGKITVEAGGTIESPVATGTTSANLPNHGHSNIGSTSAAATYVLDAPVAGVTKTIFCTAGSTDNVQKVDAGAGVTFESTAAERFARFTAGGHALMLVGRSTTKWDVIPDLSNVSLSTD